MTTPSIIAPAPWSLNGRGFVLIYHFTHAFNTRYSFMEDYQHDAYRGWMGAVMLVDYESSDVGPYQELLYIPGLFLLGGKLSFSISKIYVSSADSQWNGYNNWGIPKEVAHFTSTESDGSTQVKISKKIGAMPFFRATIDPWGPALPLSTRLLPLSHITQKKEQELLFTDISVNGSGRAARLKQMHADPLHFPPLQELEPMLCLSVEDFLMHFPMAEVVSTLAE